ncbi:MAG: hypothetical protein AAB449_03850 [Patescibacteria group bacterium]
MDELEISGKRYISSRRAAKEHKYHSDYIGQLIRANKVIGEKVGRSWYVEAESLEAYLRGEASAPAPLAIAKVAPATKEKLLPTVEPSAEDSESTQEVPEPAFAFSEALQVREAVQLPPVASDEHKIAVHISKPQESRRGLTYMSDESPLMPEIKKETTRDFESLNDEQDTAEVYVPHRKNANKRRPVLALVVVSVLTFIAVTGAAYLLHYSMIVEGETLTASISFGTQ